MTFASRVSRMSASRSGMHRAPRVIDDEALAHQPAHRDAVLEQRVHPRIRMRIVRRSRAVDRVAAGVRGHGHHAHAVGQASVDGLQVLVVEGLGQQHRRNRLHQLRVGDRAVLGLVCSDARLGVRHRLRRPGPSPGARWPAAAARTPPGCSPSEPPAWPRRSFPARRPWPQSGRSWRGRPGACRPR